MAKIRLSLENYPGNIKDRLSYISQGSVFEIFPDDFMARYTKHHDFVSFCESIGCDMTSQDDLNKLDEGTFDIFIQQRSDFTSWADMSETAYQLQIKKN